MAAGRGIRVGDRVRVRDTSPPRSTVAVTLVVGARYRFRPSREGRPFEVNRCTADRLGGFVLPPVRVREVVPAWAAPGLALAFALGCAVGARFMRRRPARPR